MIQKAIADFREYLDRKYFFLCSANMFQWDQATGSPKGGLELKGKIIGFLSGEEFSMSISNTMKNHLDVLGNHLDELDELTLGLYKKCKRDYDALAKIPVSEYMEYCELQVKSEAAWGTAKENSDFSIFAPYLEGIITYNKKFIDYRGFKDHAYNTLLDDYEPGITVSTLDTYFESLKAEIVPLLKKIQQSEKSFKKDFLSLTVPKEKQEKISYLLMRKLGYDLNRGMLKESAHPFTLSFGRTDSRITTNYDPNNFLSSFYSVIHEVGHALYEQNKKVEIESTLMDDGISTAIHESQSRFYENIIGRSYEFWELIYDELMEILGDDFRGVTINDFYEASNIVEPSLIRVAADELTYSLHVLIRYEIEKYIFSNDVDINELPKLWNSKYEQYLGITPTNDSVGILQDIHWSDGMLGYFPSYSLGSAYASQLLCYMQKDVDVYSSIKRDEICNISEWLKDKIHKHGSLYTPSELVKAINNEELEAKYYIDYLKNKYEKIYEL